MPTDGAMGQGAVSAAPTYEDERRRGEAELQEIARRDDGVNLSVVIPAKNEADNIGWVLSRLPSSVDEVVLVDGHSTDGTADVARRVRPDVRVVLDDRPGKGAALRTGFAAARGDFIVMIDADGSMDPREIELFCKRLRDRRLDRRSGEFEFVKGSRFTDGGGTSDMTPVRRLGNTALLKLVNRLYGVEFTDLCYGMMAFRRDVLTKLELQSNGFEIETEIVVRAVKSGVVMGEVPSFEAPRLNGESNLNTCRDGLRVLSTLLHERVVAWPPARRSTQRRRVKTRSRRLGR